MLDQGKNKHWHENPLLPDENDPGWKALHSLFERPWFLRVWIIQEFALPRELLMICGEWELEGDLLAQTVAMLAASRFCVMEDGFFGMVPRPTRPGDMIFTI